MIQIKNSKAIILFTLFLVFILIPIAVRADWNGITPNMTTREEAVTILGEPSLDSGSILIYDGSKSPLDTKGVAIYCFNGIVVMIRVLPKSEITEQEIASAFGKPMAVSNRAPDMEEFVFVKGSGKMVVTFTKKNKTAIRIDYL